jgi:F420-dependent oxidoreductase-like protein
LKRKLFTVVDTLGMEQQRRQSYVTMAEKLAMPCHAVVFDTPPEVCRARNRSRARPVPTKVINSQLQSWADVLTQVDSESFDGVHRPDVVELVPLAHLHALDFAAAQREDPMPLRFGLQLPSFAWEGGPSALAARLGDIAAAAEDAGFTSLWVMDHFLQIPQVGREWEDMLESYTTLGFLAARTRTARLGTLVTGVTYRNIGHVAKLVATLDVLSGGRAVAGIGAAWYEREHRAYGVTFPPLKQRYAMLEDALQLLPMMWGPGSPAFEGREVSVAEAMCYPRPLQEHVPILVGGSGEQKTLKLVARYADACNLFGDAATVRHKLHVLRSHCADVGRDPADITVTSLSRALVGRDRADVDDLVERWRRGASPEQYAAAAGAATVEEQIGRYRELAEAGVHTAILSMPNVSAAAVERFAEVIAAFPERVHTVM